MKDWRKKRIDDNMDIDAFKPRIKEEERFAVAVPTEGGIVVVIQTYHNMEQLETGYKDWLKYASQRNITKPYPIELLDDSGKCKILTALVDACK